MEVESSPPLATHIKFPETDNRDDFQMELSQNEGNLKPEYCEVCAISLSKYTCPRCEVRTCSLKCATIHKKELECDGTRDKAKYIPIKKFTNLDLSSDYRLLEEITRSLETTKKYRYKNLRTEHLQPMFMFKLKQELQTRKTFIKYLPYTFDRHKKNTTRLNYQENAVFWHIEWVFLNADSLRIHDDQVRETTKLATCLGKYFCKQEDLVLQEKLQYYQSAGIPGVRILLRAEGKSGYKFYELDPNLTLQDCFRGKIIIEYPIIEVILKGHKDDVEIIDSDDEFESSVSENSKFGSNVINKIIKKSESDENIYKAMKNLLFISEHSDGENSD